MLTNITKKQSEDLYVSETRRCFWVLSLKKNKFFNQIHRTFPCSKISSESEKKVYYKERNAFRIHKYNSIFIHTPAAGSNQDKKVNPESHSNNAFSNSYSYNIQEKFSLGKLKGISEKLLRYNGVIVNWTRWIGVIMLIEPFGNWKWNLLKHALYYNVSIDMHIMRNNFVMNY